MDEEIEELLKRLDSEHSDYILIEYLAENAFDLNVWNVLEMVLSMTTSKIDGKNLLTEVIQSTYYSHEGKRNRPPTEFIKFLVNKYKPVYKKGPKVNEYGILMDWLVTHNVDTVKFMSEYLQLEKKDYQRMFDSRKGEIDYRPEADEETINYIKVMT